MLNWKRIFLGFAFLLLPIAVAGQLDLGDRLTSAQVPKNNTVHCAATPSQTYPCVEDLIVKGVRFHSVGYDPKTNRIQHLSTSDGQFRTKDGFRAKDWVEVREDKSSLIPAGTFTDQ